MHPTLGPNLFITQPPEGGELFETLARLGPVHIERITSSSTPDPTPYDQAHDEWVALLVGTATLELAGVPHALAPGDTVMIPRHTPHRVLATSAGAVWLAVHVT